MKKVNHPFFLAELLVVILILALLFGLLLLCLSKRGSKPGNESDSSQPGIRFAITFNAEFKKNN